MALHLTRIEPAPLPRYDALCQALAEAQAVDEVLEINNKAVAMEAYARQAGNRELEAQAKGVRTRAKRRLGELMQQQKATVGLNPGGGDRRSDHRVVSGPSDPRPTLAAAGIDKHLAHDARTLAEMPADAFESHVEQVQQRVRTRAKQRGKGKRRAVDASLTYSERIQLRIRQRVEPLLGQALTLEQFAQHWGVDAAGARRYVRDAAAALDVRKDGNRYTITVPAWRLNLEEFGENFRAEIARRRKEAGDSYRGWRPDNVHSLKQSAVLDWIVDELNKLPKAR